MVAAAQWQKFPRACCLLLLYAIISRASSSLASDPKGRNVLYIVVDDLTSNLELFGGEITQV